MRRRALVPVACLAACIGLAACGTTTAPLQYQPPLMAELARGTPVYAGVSATDVRGEHDPSWIGSIRNGFGMPLKDLRTDAPVANVVANAFTQGLAARGMLAPGSGPLLLAVTVRTFNSDQMVRREAKAVFAITVTDRRSGQVVYRDEVTADVINGSAFAMDTGVFGSPEDLRQVSLQAMDQAVNQALDKPGFPGRAGS
jgi:hypothetical protein